MNIEQILESLGQSASQPTTLTFDTTLVHAGYLYSGARTGLALDLPERLLPEFLKDTSRGCAEDLGELTLDTTGADLAQLLRNYYAGGRLDPRSIVPSPATLVCEGTLIRKGIRASCNLQFAAESLSPTQLTAWIRGRYRLIAGLLFEKYERANADLGRIKCPFCGEYYDSSTAMSAETGDPLGILELLQQYRTTYGRGDGLDRLRSLFYRHRSQN